jgi:hypothetical protein
MRIGLIGPFYIDATIGLCASALRTGVAVFARALDCSVGVAGGAQR